jgi:transposase
MTLSRSSESTTYLGHYRLIGSVLGEGVLPEHLNDDVFGRTLDKIQEYGATELFNRIILQAIEYVPINTRYCHTDTTN